MLSKLFLELCKCPCFWPNLSSSKACIVENLCEINSLYKKACFFYFGVHQLSYSKTWERSRQNLTAEQWKKGEALSYRSLSYRRALAVLTPFTFFTWIISLKNLVLDKFFFFWSKNLVVWTPDTGKLKNNFFNKFWRMAVKFRSNMRNFANSNNQSLSREQEFFKHTHYVPWCHHDS